MAVLSFKVSDARKTFRLGEAADSWGGTHEKYVTPTPHVIVPDPPSGEEKASFFNFVSPEGNQDATLSAVFKSDKSWMFTKEDAPSGYSLFQVLKEAADDRELPVLDSLPSDKMTRVRREDLEAFALRKLDEDDWSLPWFLFPGERPNHNPAKSTAEAKCHQWLIKKMEGGKKAKEKDKPAYLAEAKQLFSCTKRQFEAAWERACKETRSGWSLGGRPREK